MEINKDFFMKRMTLIIVSLICVLGIQSQNYTMEQKISSLEYLSFSIDLFDDGTYVFSCTKHRINSDIIAMHLLSFGNYRETDDTYILIDAFNSYQLRLNKIVIEEGVVKKILKTTQGFGWMKKNFFVLSDEKPNDTSFLIEKFSVVPKKMEIDSKCDIDQKLELKSGKYKSESLDYKIVLDSDKSYSIYFYNFLISSGKWKTRKSILILTDTSIDEDFFAIISDRNVIKSNYLPFEFNRRSFLLSK